MKILHSIVPSIERGASVDSRWLCVADHNLLTFVAQPVYPMELHQFVKSDKPVATVDKFYQLLCFLILLKKRYMCYKGKNRHIWIYIFMGRAYAVLYN